MYNKLSKKEINSVYERLKIYPKDKYENKFEVWEVPPNKKGIRLFSTLE